jgi:hypothetical protein
MYYKDIKLEKNMYGISGKSFTVVLEEIDPSESYKNTDLENLDAYQRQLKRFGIRVSGSECDMVEKFFMTSQSAILFPEYISRAIKQGIIANDIFSDITAAVTKISGLDYRPIQSLTSDLPQGVTTNAVAEGAQLREVSVMTNPDLVELIKHGRSLSCTYEVLKYQNLEVLTVILRKVGSDIAKEQLEDALKVISNGTESINVSSIAQGNLEYDHLLQLWKALGDYNLNVMLASISSAKDILALHEMKDAVNGSDFKTSGRLTTPLGAKLIKISSIKGNTIFGLDKTCAIQMIRSGGVLTDYDKIIDRQLEKAAITVTAGFAKFFAGAIKKLVY